MDYKSIFSTYIIFKGQSNSTIVQLIRYSFVGVIAFFIDYGTLWGLNEWCGFHYLSAAGIAFILGLITNYALSRLWVFRTSVLSNKQAEFFIFALIGVIGLGFTELLMWAFTSALGLHYLLSKAITTVIVYFWNFFARKYILFNRTSSTTLNTQS